ncbi:MAG: FixG Ig-like domain-containing protein [Alphaproteobacteria bacterium]|nr:FixG Ig-like domain-containing protein [Alphaproteobacteria bacterium]
MQADSATMGGGAPRRALKSLVGIYPAAVRGRLRSIKWAAQILLLAVYYIVPWLRWDRGEGAPNQMILVDADIGRIFLLDMEIWPGDLYVVTGLLILSALGLFLVTALFGRIWCGFSCPQTVWTDLFMQVERWIEGDRGARMRMAMAPMSLSKAGKKVAKHALWIVIAASTGGAFVLYFIDAPTVFPLIFTGEAPVPAYLFIGVLTALTYALAGGAREKVCTHMCPWPRFQSALLDADSLVVTYQDWRAEPRGKVKAPLRPSLQSLEGEGALAHSTLQELAEAAAAGVQAGESGRGDCIDCNQCVVVCPMGIDIRKGLQFECIGCGLCIDACNAIMDKVKRPHGLIAFDSESNHAARSAGQPPLGRRLIRPRTIIYVLAAGLIAAITLFALISRDALVLSVIPDRQPVFVRLSDGGVRNTYTVRISNKQRDVLDFRLAVTGVDGLLLRSASGEDAIEAASDPGLQLQAGSAEVETWTVFVTAPRGVGLRGRNEVDFVVRDAESGAVLESKESYIWGPE